MSIYNSERFIKELKERPENFYVIHYSCESLYDENEALSPKITSIAVTHYATEQTVSFSTHAIAEEMHIAREQVRDRFDEIERKLLTDFYEFVRDRRDKHWVTGTCEISPSDSSILSTATGYLAASTLRLYRSSGA